MKFVIVGGGAMGSLFAWYLARTEAEVWIYDLWEAHVDAIRRDGLRVRHRGAMQSVDVRSCCDPTEPGEADVAMVFVKHGQTLAALRSVQPVIGRHTLLVTLQNGIGNVEIARSLYDNRILYGLTTLTSEMIEPGLIEASYDGAGETYMWPTDAVVDERVQAIVQTLRAGGVNAHVTPDIDQKIWHKLIVNCCLNTMCAITGKNVGELIDGTDVWPVLDGVVDELVLAAKHEGIDLDPARAHAYLRTVAQQARSHVPSMLVDVRHGRRTEIACLNGAVLEICQRHGMAAPFNQTLHSIVSSIDAGR